jgi:hypothetical protein
LNFVTLKIYEKAGRNVLQRACECVAKAFRGDSRIVSDASFIMSFWMNLFSVEHRACEKKDSYRMTFIGKQTRYFCQILLNCCESVAAILQFRARREFAGFVAAIFVN